MRWIFADLSPQLPFGTELLGKAQQGCGNGAIRKWCLKYLRPLSILTSCQHTNSSDTCASVEHDIRSGILFSGARARESDPTVRRRARTTRRKGGLLMRG